MFRFTPVAQRITENLSPVNLFSGALGETSMSQAGADGRLCPAFYGKFPP